MISTAHSYRGFQPSVGMGFFCCLKILLNFFCRIPPSKAPVFLSMICWYTLSRFIATNSGSLDLDLSINTEDFRSTHIGVCRGCGRYMEMKSNRQLYCKRDDCQRDRNRRKQKDFQQRKRENAN